MKSNPAVRAYSANVPRTSTKNTASSMPRTLWPSTVGSDALAFIQYRIVLTRTLPDAPDHRRHAAGDAAFAAMRVELVGVANGAAIGRVDMILRHAQREELPARRLSQ